MLVGEAAASVFAYRHQYTVDPAIQTLGPDGTVLVIVPVTPGLEELTFGEDERAIKVRLDLSKHSPDPRVVVQVASAHLLGDLRWVHPDDELLAQLPSSFADLVRDLGEGARLGAIDFEKVILHDCDGIVAVGRDELSVPIGVTATPDEVLEWASGWRDQVLIDMADAGLRGELLADWSDFPLQSGAKLTLPAACHCLDVSETGLSLLRVRDEGAVIVHVPFAQCPDFLSV